MEPPATFFPSSSFTDAAAGGHQSEEELLTALRKGSFLLKHGRHGRPKAHFFRLAACDNELRWRSASGAVKSVVLASVRDFLPGQATEVFRRHPVREPAASFSLRYVESPSGSIRTLDLTCRDREQYLLWYPGLQIAVQRSIALAAAASGGGAGGAVPPRAGGGFVEQQQGVEQIVPGDLFIWGCASNPSFNRASTPPPPQEIYFNNNKNSSRESQLQSSVAECWPRRLTPTPVPLNSILDASTASVGRRHAAIVSAQGSLYVLGEGNGGKLGRGHDNPAPVPQRTSRGLPGDGKIIATSCGDEYTAAITPEGQLLTWGRLPGEPLPVVLPTVVRGGLTNISVCQVSCGPFHTAAVAFDGRLFTWGEGFGGKLGHGDQITRLQPTHVVALQSMPVLQVACGVWHTAAIVLEPPGLHPAHPNPLPPMSPGGGGVGGGGAFFGGGEIFSNIAAAPPSPKTSNSSKPSDLLLLPSTPSRSHHRRTSSSISGAGDYGGYQEGRGGALYTWGGVNEAVAFGDTNTTQRRDSNKGCLGHGDVDLYTGQTLPTRVGGPGCQLTGKGVRSIAAGLHLTVALTTSGLVYQMGSTGASGSNSSVLAPWEGSITPEPVRGQLSTHFVDAIACGMHHVVVLARPIEKKVGRPVENSIPTVFTWGRGSEGQLGTGKWDDSASPVAIEENLKGRRAVAIAAGGATTMVVCDHDVKKFEDVGLLLASSSGKEATEQATKALLALLEPRNDSGTNAGNNNTNSLLAGGGSRSGWLLTRDERPPSRSNIFRGSSSFSFTSAASGSTSGIGAGGAMGAGGGGGSGPVNLNLSRMSSSSLHSLGSSGGNAGNGGGGNGSEFSYPPYSIISISGPAAPTGGGAGGLSRKSSLHHTEGTGMRSNMSSSSSLSQSQSGTMGGKYFDPFGNNGSAIGGSGGNSGALLLPRRSFSGTRPSSPNIGGGANSARSMTPGTSSPGSIKGTATASRIRSGINDAGGGTSTSTRGGTAVLAGVSTSSLSASPGAGSSSSSSNHQSNTTAAKGRYIARLEQRLEELNKNKGDVDGGTGILVVEQGDEKLKQAVAESALQYRESMKGALEARSAAGNIDGNTTTTAVAQPPHQPQPPPRLILPVPHPNADTSFTPAPTPSSISDPAVLEQLLQRKQADLERQQQALAAWAEELRMKEEALLRGLGSDAVVASSAHSQSTTPIATEKTAETTTGRTTAAVAGGDLSSKSATNGVQVAAASATAAHASLTGSTLQQGSTTGFEYSHNNVLAPTVDQQEQQQEQQEPRSGDADENLHSQQNKEEEEQEEAKEEEEEWVEQLEQGVTATFIRDPTTGTSRLKRLRFSKTHFSASTASTWYNSNAYKLIQVAESSSLSAVAYPPPSVGLSESATTTPTKEIITATRTRTPGAMATVGAGAGGGSVATRQMMAHGRVDSRNMSFDARELAQLHAELQSIPISSSPSGAMHQMTTTSTADGAAAAAPLTTPLSSSFSPSSSPLPSSPLALDESLIHQEPQNQQHKQLPQQEFHTPLAKNIKEEDDGDGTGKVRARSTGIAPSPALESLFNQAAAATAVSVENKVQQLMMEVSKNREQGEKDEEERIDDDDDDDDESSSDVSLVSASSGGRKKSTISDNSGTGVSGVVLSPPPPRRPSPTRRPRSGGSNVAALNRLRSFALSDVHSTASLSPTTSARSLDVSSGFRRPGSQSPVHSTAAASAGGGGGGGGGSGLFRSVAAKIARSIIGGEDYTNISIPSPTTSAASSSTDQHQEGQAAVGGKTSSTKSMSAPVFAFGGRRSKSGDSSKSRR